MITLIGTGGGSINWQSLTQRGVSITSLLEKREGKGIKIEKNRAFLCFYREIEGIWEGSHHLL